jgi:putative endonuclease
LPTPRSRLGAEGERRAVLMLQEKGFEIVAQNAFVRAGELDIVALDGDCWVFVEVKTRRSDRYGSAAESITLLKQSRLIRAALTWLEKQELHDVSWRFDVVTVRFHPNRPPVIEHIPNAFG